MREVADDAWLYEDTFLEIIWPDIGYRPADHCQSEWNTKDFHPIKRRKSWLLVHGSHLSAILCYALGKFACAYMPTTACFLSTYFYSIFYYFYFWCLLQIFRVSGDYCHCSTTSTGEHQDPNSGPCGGCAVRGSPFFVPWYCFIL